MTLIDRAAYIFYDIPEAEIRDLNPPWVYPSHACLVKAYIRKKDRYEVVKASYDRNQNTWVSAYNVALRILGWRDAG